MRAWTHFVEHGDRAEGLVRPEILRSWERSAPGRRHRRERGAAGRRVRHDLVLERLAAPGRPSSASSPELRRTAEDGDLVVAVTDAETRILWTYGGRVMRRKAETVNFVAGRALGRHERRHQRARPRHPQRRALDGVQRRALRPDRAQLGLLGGARARPRERRAARCHRPLHHVGPDAPDRDGDRAGDGPADRDRDAGLQQHLGAARGGRRRRSPASTSPSSEPPRPTSTGPACCSTAARPRSSPCSRSTRPGSRSSTCTRCSTATTRSPSPPSRRRSRTCAARSTASSRRGPTG